MKEPGMTSVTDFGWLQIARLGLVQACLGAVVVICTSTLNRLMVVELALPALLPGLLVGLHYAVQMVRPRMGYGADMGRRCTPWMMGGVAVLALGGWLAAAAVAWMGHAFLPGLALSVLAFVLIGLGVSACGTSLLVLMAKRVPPARRAPAATLVWMMMILGFALTSIIVGRLIDPYSPQRLLLVTGGLGGVVVVLSALALWRLEGPVRDGDKSAAPTRARPDFRRALAEVWAEPRARLFTLFVFLSMLAYSGQDLILEPFAGQVFGLTPGQTTQLSGLQHAAVLSGMLWVAFIGSAPVRGRLGSVQAWMVWGCVLSAVAMAGLCSAGLSDGHWPLRTNVALLGWANGAFSIAAIATMMTLSSEGAEGREGTRMGLWGAAQAIAFALGGTLGTAASDLARWLLASDALAYASVFMLEALVFLVSALCARLVMRGQFAARGQTLPHSRNPSRIAS